MWNAMPKSNAARSKCSSSVVAMRHRWSNTGLCLVCVFHCVTNARLHAVRSEFLCPSSCRAQCACWNHDSFLSGVREGIPAVVKGCQIYSWTAQAISVGRTWDVAVRANCKGTVWKSWNYKRLCAGFHGCLIVDNSWLCVDVLPPLFLLKWLIAQKASNFIIQILRYCSFSDWKERSTFISSKSFVTLWLSYTLSWRLPFHHTWWVSSRKQTLQQSFETPSICLSLLRLQPPPSTWSHPFSVE